MAFFRTFVGAFHSAETYQQARNTEGHKLGYSFGLVALCCLLTCLVVTTILDRTLFSSQQGKTPVVDDVVRQIARQIPHMSWHEGRLASESTTPTIIHIEGETEGKPFQFALATIDTSGTADYSTIPTPIVITHKDVYFKNAEKTEVRQLADIMKNAPTLIITPALAADIGEELILGLHKHRITFYAVLLAFIWPIITLVWYVARVLLLVSIALMLMLIAQAYKQPLRFTTSMRLTAVAFTPVATLACIVMLLGDYPHTIVLFAAGLTTAWLALRITRDTPLAAAP